MAGVRQKIVKIKRETRDRKDVVGYSLAHPATVRSWVPGSSHKPGVVESKFKAILGYIASLKKKRKRKENT